MAQVSVTYSISCLTKSERDTLLDALTAQGSTGNFTNVSTPTDTLIVLDREDVLSLVDGNLVYEQGEA